MTGPQKNKGIPSASALNVPLQASLSANTPLPARRGPAHSVGKARLVHRPLAP